ncbi:LysM peptidoglycan-binding domain-containing protein [Agrobacterium rubi]|uniref:LysM peptidoglycan-binding domain-containing protein n=1 Tax=Agrobacterium rubi TaxID=28099 RepID=UPI001571F1D0|nr:LysM peptidoglycan-binding domain-containing protein [Agrobacterium rubi]NTF07012.1 LysM peptidoglycan-binding domain-containing protein [Agrobacterium rubi]NTF19253.1 LysM peptidoglycan-binding domain-containing protein [Agrobacterium rubi]NTF26216.1 LysM peptidoglycan-binding domain-containing protein [Agrobacterium rubi]
MNNKRAGLLALIVLGVATLLMVFFVLPRMSSDDKPIGDAINDAGNAVKNSVEMGGEKAGDLLSDAAKDTENVADKVGRLAESANKSIKDMTGRFADNKVPSNEEFTAARKKVEDSLKELETIDIPEALDENTSRLITTARSAAERTIAFLRGLPADAGAAAAQVRRLPGVFTGTDDGAPRPQPAAPAAPATAPASPTPAPADAAQLPTFDVLRVEPDGSAVIAGKAAPNTTLEIVNNGQVIAKTPVEGSGDFAAVLDNPLPPGDHQIILRATAKDGKVSQSAETATVSVPTQKSGELLAMVTTPGKASRVLTMPTAAPDALQAQATPPANGAAAQPQSQTQAPAAGAAQNGSAATPTAPTNNAPSQPSSEAATIRVVAVEFEGSKIFVAGAAPANAAVRVLVDDKAIGNGKAEASGSFVIEGNVDLSVGNHIVTAEALDAAGNVTVRVRVPFARPANDQATVAAQKAPVAPQPPSAGSAPQTQAQTEAPSATSDRAVFESLREEVSKAFSILSGLYTDGATPRLEEVAAAKSATAIALRSLSEFRTAATADADFTTFVSGISAKARSLLSVINGLPDDVAMIGKRIAGLADRFAELNVAVPGPAEATPPQAQAQAQTQPQAPAETGPKTFEQAPLSHSEGAVIIRRGDTLWQISRRVYGQGVRYTTIYLANQDQIKNPDLIEPGQIFGVPDSALPNAEEIHRKRLMGR